jgi:hypothetical protein
MLITRDHIEELERFCRENAAIRHAGPEAPNIIRVLPRLRECNHCDIYRVFGWYAIYKLDEVLCIFYRSEDEFIIYSDPHYIKNVYRRMESISDFKFLIQYYSRDADYYDVCYQMIRLIVRI